MTIPAESPPQTSSYSLRHSLKMGLLGGLIIAVILLGWQVYQHQSEKRAAASTLHQFMQAMAADDLGTAYGFFSSRSQVIFSLEELGILKANNPHRYTGYANLSLAQFEMTTVSHQSPHAPQGKVAQVSGTITYADGSAGLVSAALEKEAGQWRIAFVEINHGPDPPPSDQSL